MDPQQSKETLRQLRAYTVEVAKLLGASTAGKGKNSNGLFSPSAPPVGAITHYTASNLAVGPNRPYGRLPILLERFQPGSTQQVGVHFIVWDSPIERFQDIWMRYDLLRDMPGEGFCMMNPYAPERFWHAGSANDWAYGIEIRNIGRVTQDKKGDFFWEQVNRYRGRPPIKMKKSWWEPYTWHQMAMTLWLHRLMASIYPIKPERFLGHIHISSTRIDPGPHFPIHEMREYALFQQDVPIDNVPFLEEFPKDTFKPIDDPMVSETSLHQGLYRHDWDGDPELGATTEEVDEAKKNEVKGQIPKVRDTLIALGYYIKPDDKDSLIETLKLFQSRWKVRRASGKGWRNELPSTGILNQVTVNKVEDLDKLVRSW